MPIPHVVRSAFRAIRAPFLPLLLALAGACASELPLPAKPVVAVVPGPRVVRVEPPSAFAQARVRVVGEHLQGEGLEVRFEGSGPLSPAAIAPDGTWLEVEVPLAARDGSVTVVNAHGRAQSEEPFAMKGAGRLRHGRVANVADLRWGLLDAKILPTGGLLVRAVDPLSLGYVGLVGRLDVEGSFAPLRTPPSLAMAITAARTQVVTVSPTAGCEDPNEVCEPEAIRLEIRAIADDTLVASARLEYPAGQHHSNDFNVTTDDDGRFAVVSTSAAAWFVERTGATLKVRPYPEPWRLAEYEPDVAWLGDSRFAVAEDVGFRLLDATDPRAGSPLWKPLGDRDSFGVRLAVAGGLAAVAYYSDHEIRLFDLRGETPVEAGRLGAAFSSRIDYLEVSADARRIAMTWNGWVSTFDATTHQLLGSVPIEVARGLSSADGLFVVSGRGTVALVAAQTGSLASTITARARWHSPRIATRPCGPEGAPTQVLTLSSFAFGVVARLDATTLEASECQPRAAPVQQGRLVASVVVPGSNDLLRVVRHAGRTELLRESSDGRTDPKTLVLQGLEVMPGGANALVDEAATSLVLRTGTDAYDAEVHVVPLGAAWPPTGAAASVKLSTGVRAMKLSGDRLLALSYSKLHGYDLAAARAGEVKELWPTIDFGQDAEGILKGVGGLGATGDTVLATTDDHVNGRVLWQVSPATGEAKAVGLPPPSLDEHLLPAPGGRVLWWLTSAFDRGLDLHALELDLAHEQVGPELSPVPVPMSDTFTRLREEWLPEAAVSADGERLVVTWGLDDRAALLE